MVSLIGQNKKHSIFKREVVATDRTTVGALFGIYLGTAGVSGDDGALFGMELGTDDGTEMVPCLTMLLLLY